ncbi:aminoglycoside phosphotransferase [Paraliobacillus quinghaiensis]|uniref:Aminoglycoside phosphotransferase n=1 Tax=Paraliobacillus quinghaiensis TaxID=470815 RepID=A0A917TR41_9BACI|nr:fructosamine kinase family protein [Paraliobacillus quinghaiensis]GGM32985.1 aminoglycoside phosphotransferase [Paraliobacillus quinghaiensis]
MRDIIHETMGKVDKSGSISSIIPVSGGEINQAYRVDTDQQSYFVKTNRDVPSHFFRFEANGVALIKNTNTIAVPEVYYYNEPKENEQAIFVMEWVEGNQTSKTITALGEKIAALHQHSHTHYGLDQDGFTGQINQPNQFTSDWISYFRDYRLRTQLIEGSKRGRFTKERQAKLEKLIATIDTLLPAHPKASLLHGDLWGGNWLTGTNGTPYVIDPAVLYGDHLFELAYIELDGYPQTFYTAYQSVMPIADYYEDIKPLYQLYYLLVHLTIFGEKYGADVDRILTRYV